MPNILRIALLGIALFTSAISSAGDVYVRGHTRSDGAYVAPHYRSSPDNSYNNNWSTSPNMNPYTGSIGTSPPTWNDEAPRNDSDYNYNYNRNIYGR